MLAGGTRQKGFRMEEKTGFCWWRLEGGEGGEKEGSRNMLGGGGRIRCAVCADESFSFEKKTNKTFLGAALEADLKLTVCVEP